MFKASVETEQRFERRLFAEFLSQNTLKDEKKLLAFLTRLADEAHDKFDSEMEVFLRLKVLELTEKLAGKNSSKFLDALSFLGDAEVHDFPELAVKHLQECVQKAEKKGLTNTRFFGERLVSLADAMHGVACLRDKHDKQEFEKAFEMFKRGIEKLEKVVTTKKGTKKGEKIVGTESFLYSYALITACDICDFETYDFAQAWSLALKARAVIDRDHGNYAYLMMLTFTACAGLGDSDHAWEIYPEAIESCIREHGKMSENFGNNLQVAAQLKFKENKVDEALALLRDAVQISTVCKGDQEELDSRLHKTVFDILEKIECPEEFQKTANVLRGVADRTESYWESQSKRSDVTCIFLWIWLAESFFRHRRANDAMLCLWDALLLMRARMPASRASELTDAIRKIFSFFSPDVICEQVWASFVCVKVALRIDTTEREMELLFREGSDRILRIAKDVHKCMTQACVSAVAKNPDIAARRFALKWSGRTS
jgi:hypothetical protein